MKKRIIAAILSAFTAICCTNVSLCVFAEGDKSSWYYSETETLKEEKKIKDFVEDCEEFDEGVLPRSGARWLTNSKTEAYVKVSKNSKTGNKSVIIGTNADCGSNTDAFINPVAAGTAGAFFISFDVNVDSFKNGNFYLSLRDADSGTKSSYDLVRFSAADQNITYFENNVNNNGDSNKCVRPISKKSMNVGFLCNVVDKTVTAYEEGEKVWQIDNCDKVSNSNKMANFDNFYARFYLSAQDESSVEIDNIRMLEMPQNCGDVTVKANTVYDDDGYRNTLHTGDAALEYLVINNGSTDRNMNIIAAEYRDNYLISADVVSCDIPKESFRTVSGELKNTCREGGEIIRIYAFEKYSLAPQTEVTQICEMNYTDHSEKMLLSSVVAKLKNNKMYGVHPRLMATAEDFEKIKNFDALKGQCEDILSQADKAVRAGNNDITYKLDNGRLLNISRKVKNRIILLALAYRISGEEKYLNAAWDVMEKACAFQDWHTKHLLDTSEMCAGIAIGYDWLYDDMTSERREVVEEALWSKALDYAYQCYSQNSGSWFKETVNRNIVNNGSFVIGALALMDIDKYQEKCSEIIRSGVYYIGYMLNSFAPDGAWDEGIGYLGYTLEYLAKTYASLETALGNDLGLTDVQGLSGVNRFILSASGSGGRNNFHDDGDKSVFIVPEMLYLANKFSNDAEANEYNELKTLLGNKSAYGDLLWYRDRETSASETLSPDAYFRKVEFASMRGDAGGIGSTYLSFHGGKSNDGEGHMHIDAGTFVLDLGGVRWASDLGTDRLTYSYMGSADMGKRKTVYRVRAEGHNTLVINPTDSTIAETIGGGQAKDTDARVEDFGTVTDGAWAVLDLSSAYPGSCESVKRKFALTDNRTAAEIYDEINLKSTSEIYWFMHTLNPTEVQNNADGSMTLSRDGKKIKISAVYEADGTKGDLEISLVDAQKLESSPETAVPNEQDTAVEADNSAYKKVQIKITNAPKGVNKLKVKIQQVDYDYF